MYEGDPANRIALHAVRLCVFMGVADLVFGCRWGVVDLADAVCLDDPSAMLKVVLCLAVGLDLALDDDRRPFLECGGGASLVSPHLHVEPVGAFVLYLLAVRPSLIDGTLKATTGPFGVCLSSASLPRLPSKRNVFFGLYMVRLLLIGKGSDDPLSMYVNISLHHYMVSTV